MMAWIERGGPVMWPLLALSAWTLWLVFERLFFWLRSAGEGRAAFDRARERHLGERELDPATLEELLAADDRRANRGLASFEVIVAAAPMLGILGTVLGIIEAFGALSARANMDPLAVSGGVAEALLTTAAGLVVALSALFPGHYFRARAERRAEGLEREGRRRLLTS